MLKKVTPTVLLIYRPPPPNAKNPDQKPVQQANGKRSWALLGSALHGPRYLFVLFSAACFALHGPCYFFALFSAACFACTALVFFSLSSRVSWGLLGHFLPLLGLSWALLGRSWAPLGPLLGALGGLLGGSWASLGRSWGDLGTTCKNQ